MGSQQGERCQGFFLCWQLESVVCGVLLSLYSLSDSGDADFRVFRVLLPIGARVHIFCLQLIFFLQNIRRPIKFDLL